MIITRFMRMKKEIKRGKDDDKNVSFIHCATDAGATIHSVIITKHIFSLLFY